MQASNSLSIATSLLLFLSAMPAIGSEPSSLSGTAPDTSKDVKKATKDHCVLAWHDEFDKDGLPNPVKWNYELGPKLRNGEAQDYTQRPENARVENGCLVIEARRESYKGSEYTSASLTTRNTFPFVYGRVEVRAKIPEGRGLWPAIWLVGYDSEKISWPAIGEIDMMENVGFDPKTLFFTIHTLDNNHAKGNEIQASLPVENVYEDFHLYTLDWTPKSLVLSFDGREVLRYDKTVNSMGSWPFFNPMYLILNVAIGGEWGGAKGIDDAIFPRRMLVDYVRVYKLKSSKNP